MRLSALDALNFYFSRYTDHREAGEMCSLIGIDSGNASPSFPEIQATLADRIARIPALQERIAPAPGDVTFPHWVPDPQPITAKIIEGSGDTWADVVNAVIDISDVPVDSTQSTWRAIVYRNVTGAPDIPDRATVVYMQVAHCVTDGQGMTKIQRAIFGDGTASTTLPGHGNPTKDLGIGAAGLELAKLPWNLLQGYRAARAARSAPTDHGSVQIEKVPALNEPGERRAFANMRIVPLANLRWAGTVTETGLAAVSIALERYLQSFGDLPDTTVYAQIPVVPSGTAKLELPIPSANSVSSSVNVALGIGSASLSERSAAIRASLEKGLADNAGETHLAQRQVLERLPVQTIRAAARNAIARAAAHAPTHTALTSYRKGKPDLALLGHRVVFFGGLPLLHPYVGVSQALIGFGDRVAVCVTATETFKEPERYVELLHAAIKQEI